VHVGVYVSKVATTPACQRTSKVCCIWHCPS